MHIRDLSIWAIPLVITFLTMLLKINISLESLNEGQNRFPTQSL